MKKTDIILIGGGGHCKSTIDVVESENKYLIKGIIDTVDNVGKTVLGYPIIGCDKDLEELVKDCKNFIITAGQIKSSDLRAKLFALVKRVGGNLPVIVSSSAYVSKYAKIGEGTVVYHNAIVNTNAEVGANCILNSRSVIEHDAKIGNNCHVSTGAIVNGGSQLGSDSFLGSMSCILNQIKVGRNCIIGAGTVIVKDLENNQLVYGNHPRIFKHLEKIKR